jgi:hypothetical protein
MTSSRSRTSSACNAGASASVPDATPSAEARSQILLEISHEGSENVLAAIEDSRDSCQNFLPN